MLRSLILLLETLSNEGTSLDSCSVKPGIFNPIGLHEAFSPSVCDQNAKHTVLFKACLEHTISEDNWARSATKWFSE